MLQWSILPSTTGTCSFFIYLLLNWLLESNTLNYIRLKPFTGHFYSSVICHFICSWQCSVTYIGFFPMIRLKKSSTWAGIMCRVKVQSEFSTQFDWHLPSGYQITSPRGCFRMYTKHNSTKSFHIMGFSCPVQQLYTAIPFGLLMKQYRDFNFLCICYTIYK